MGVFIKTQDCDTCCKLKFGRKWRLAALVRDEDFFVVWGLNPSSFGWGCKRWVTAIAIGCHGYELGGKPGLVLLLAGTRARGVSDTRLPRATLLLYETDSF